MYSCIRTCVLNVISWGQRCFWSNTNYQHIWASSVPSMFEVNSSDFISIFTPFRWLCRAHSLLNSNEQPTAINCFISCFLLYIWSKNIMALESSIPPISVQLTVLLVKIVLFEKHNHHFSSKVFCSGILSPIPLGTPTQSPTFPGSVSSRSVFSQVNQYLRKLAADAVGDPVAEDNIEAEELSRIGRQTICKVWRILHLLRLLLVV